MKAFSCIAYEPKSWPGPPRGQAAWNDRLASPMA